MIITKLTINNGGKFKHDFKQMCDNYGIHDKPTTNLSTIGLERYKSPLLSGCQNTNMRYNRQELRGLLQRVSQLFQIVQNLERSFMIEEHLELVSFLFRKVIRIQESKVLIRLYFQKN
jgi:hypothetical protein